MNIVGFGSKVFLSRWQKRFSLFFFIGFLLGSPLLYGNDRQNDPEFALNLLRWGYVDLAEECAKNLLRNRDFLGENRSSLDRIGRGSAEYVLVEVEKAKADLATTEEERKRHLQKYEEMLKAFQRKYPNHPQALNGALNLLLTNRKEAVHQLVKAQVEADEKKRKQRIREGYQLFKKVIQDFKKLIKRYEKSIQTTVEQKMKELKAKEKDPFARDEIDEYYTQEYLARESDAFYDLLRRRVLAEYILGETCLLFVRWQERLETDEDSHKYLKMAQDSFRKIEVDYSDFMSINAKAGLGLGEVLMRMGKLKAATNKFDGFTQFRFPFRAKDPVEREQQEAFEKEIACEAVHGLAKVWIKRKRYDNAILVVDKIFKKYPDALSTEGGRMALLAKCEAMTLLPNADPYKAMEEAFKVVEWSRKNEKKVPGRDFGVSALKAAVRMSQIRKLIKGQVQFAPEVSLMIATGFWETGKYKWAIYSYKDVISAPNVDEELVVLSLKGLGHCYYNTKRYEEAAMAFSGVLERFPHRSQEAVSLARQALGILSDKFGKEDEAVREFKKNLENRLGGASTMYNRGVEDRVAALKFKEENKNSLAVKRFKEAIKSFEKVKPVDENGKKVTYYGDAMASIGDCYYQIYKIEGKKEYLDKAIHHLEKMLRKFQGKDLRGWAATAYYLGKIYVDLEKFDKALKILKPFDDRLKSMKFYATPAKSLVIRSAIALGKNKIAEYQFKKLKDTEGPDSPRTAAAAQLLTATYAKFVEREREKIRNGFKIYSLFFNRTNLSDLIDSKKLVNHMLQKNEHGVPRLKIAETQAAKYAIFLYKYYKKKGTASFSQLYWYGDLVLKAKNYNAAIPIFEMLVKMRPKVDKKAPKGQATASQRYVFFAKTFLAHAYLGYGKQRHDINYLKKALKQYEELAKNKDFNRNIFVIYRVIEGKAVAAEEISKLTREKGDLAKAIQYYREFRQLLMKLTQRRYQYAAVKTVDEPDVQVRFYQVTYKLFELLYKIQNFREVVGRIKALKDAGADFGTPELKAKFELLLKEAKKRI